MRLSIIDGEQEGFYIPSETDLVLISPLLSKQVSNYNGYRIYATYLLTKTNTKTSIEPDKYKNIDFEKYIDFHPYRETEWQHANYRAGLLSNLLDKLETDGHQHITLVSHTCFIRNILYIIARDKKFISGANRYDISF